MKAKITEIFRSIQGEGKYVGSLQVFVRFLGCDMSCCWCDTSSFKGDENSGSEELDTNEVVSRISRLAGGCHSISLTGGEPLLQKDFIKELLPLLKQKNFITYLETNGVLFSELGELIDDIDIIAMDIKMPSSTKDRAFWTEHEEFLKIAVQKDVFIKTVVTQDTRKEDIEKASNLIRGIDKNILLVLQPNTADLNGDVVGKCLEYQKVCLKLLSDVRIVPQCIR